LRDAVASLCAQVEAYIDFPEDEIEPASEDFLLQETGWVRDRLSLLSQSFEEGRFFREGLRIAIVGRPNVGKSSLLNALLRRDRAIVTDTPGTTRDIIEEYLNLKGLPVRIMDTAGIRETHEMAEREGVIRSLKAIDNADVAIAVIDRSVPLHREDREVLERIKNKKSIIALNKSDLPDTTADPGTCLGDYSRNILRISAKTGAGIDPLKDLILDTALASSRRPHSGGHEDEGGGVIVTNVRHKTALDFSADALERAADVLRSHQPLEIVAIEMRDALDRLGEIVGAVTTEDILERIFSEFCIGK
jgi:tRNA modification GTPase